MRISIIIPALNEAGSIGPLLTEIASVTVHQVIVVDNGSTDGTAKAALVGGAEVILEPRHGYGFACAAGAAAAIGDILVFLDGDGSFSPAELPDLVAPIACQNADMVLGTRAYNRLISGIMPFHQRLGNRLVVWLLKLFYGIPLTDLGPYRAIRRELLLALDMQEHTYGWPLEMIIKMARRHCRIVELPVTYLPRRAGKSKVGGTVRGSFLAGYRFFRVLFRYLFSD